MIALIISLLLQIGTISSAAEFHNLDSQQQEQYIQTYQAQIIIEDVDQM